MRVCCSMLQHDETGGEVLRQVRRCEYLMQTYGVGTLNPRGLFNLCEPPSRQGGGGDIELLAFV